VFWSHFLFGIFCVQFDKFARIDAFTSMTSLKIDPPKIRENSAEAFDKFILQFERYLRILKPKEEDKLDLFLLSIGDGLAGYYDELEWKELTEEEKNSGMTEYKRAKNFISEKLSGGKNILSERIRLYSSKQQPGQSINDYVSQLRQIAQYCKFPSSFTNEALRDAFCQGLESDSNRKAVCQSFALFNKSNKTFSLEDAVAAVQIEESARSAIGSIDSSQCVEVASTHVSTTNKSCFWCGSKILHGRKDCPANGKTCSNCKGIGHFHKVCRKPKEVKSSAVFISAIQNDSGARRYITGKIKDIPVSWLVDSGSEVSFIRIDLAKKLGLSYNHNHHTSLKVISASGNKISVLSKIAVCLELDNHFVETELLICEGTSDEAVLGIPALSQFRSVNFKFSGVLPALNVGSLSTVEGFAEIFDKSSTISTDLEISLGVTDNAKAVRCPSRKRSPDDEKFIREEVSKLAKENIIVPSKSSWRSQVVVAKQANGKKRLCVDYASTINRSTVIDAFPVPLIEDVLRQLHGQTIFSTVDLRSAYFQVPLLPSEWHFTAFEAAGELWEFTRLPFGVTNGVPIFCRVIKDIVKDLPGVVHYFDDIVIAGKTAQEHKRNLKAFLERCKLVNLTLNSKKCSFEVSKLDFLGHTFENGTMTPDSDRLRPLLEYPLPTTFKQLERFLGLAVYYSKWIKGFADVAEPLFVSKNKRSFPLNSQSVQAFTNIKNSIASASLSVPVPGVPLTLETDASLTSIGSVLSQNGRPIAFYSHRLNKVEQKWPAVELEAYAIVKSIEKFRSYLLARSFTILTDQKSVSFLFDNRPKSSVKNSKLCRWRMELSEYNYQIIYRRGEENRSADALSRLSSVSKASDKDELIRLVHSQLGHPGVDRQYWFMKRFKQQNISMNEISKIVTQCDICAQLKPRFAKVPSTPLIDSEQPFRKLSIDFVGPKVRTNNGNEYIFTVVDEKSRFPFAFAVPSATTKTAIDCLSAIFSLFGPPHTIHSDRGRQFESRDFASFLKLWGVTRSRTTPYHPNSNGQCERMNGVIWKTCLLRLKENGSGEYQWDKELPLALNNIRSLPSRALDMQSPHEILFNFSRRSYFEDMEPSQKSNHTEFATPNWLKEGHNAYYKNHTRKGKSDPLVELVRVRKIVSPHVAVVEFQNSGRSDTVSISHLSRAPNSELSKSVEVLERRTNFIHDDNTQPKLDLDLCSRRESGPLESTIPVSIRPQRSRRPPTYLHDYKR